MLARPSRLRTTPRREPIHLGPTWCYWIDDADQGVPLYVGVTAHLEDRLRTHRREKSWWSQAVYVHAALYGSRALALAWEAAEIVSGTRYNVVKPLLRNLPADWSPNTSALDMAQFIVGEDI